MNKEIEIDWNEPPLVRWLGTTSRKGTAKVYRSAYRAYAEYTGLTATQLIDEAVEDTQRDVRERKDVLKTRILGFYNWLKEKGKADCTAHAFVGGVRSFYSSFDLSVKMKGRQRLPKAHVHNKRMQLTTLDVKALVDNARSPRDRAIVLVGFQGGMDVSTLCGMTYGDISDRLAKNEQPLKVDLHREKTGTEFYTFLGKDAVNALKAYLNDARARGIQFKNNTPLFVQDIKSKKGEPLALYPSIIQKIMRLLGTRSGLVDSENNGHDQNPTSPHSLRESFSSIMINNGVPDSVVDFWLGHEIGAMSDAYKGGRFNELKAMYADKEKMISIHTSNNHALEDVKKEFSDSIANLVIENRALKEQIAKIQEDLKWAIDEIKALEEEAPEK